jgi:hypothetical protein
MSRYGVGRGVLVSGAMAATLVCTAVAGQWVGFTSDHLEPVQVTIAAGDESSMQLEVGVAGIAWDEVRWSGETYVRLSIPGCGGRSEVGHPQLPVVRRLVEIPYGAQVRLVVLDDVVEEYSLSDLGIEHRIAPVPTPLPKLRRGEGRSDLVLDDKVYERPGYQPAEHVVLGTVAMVRGRRVVELVVNPVQYDPVDGLIRIHTEIVIRLEFDGSDWAATKQGWLRYRSRTFDEQWSGLIESAYGDQWSSLAPPELPLGYLIIAYDGYEAPAVALAEWKRKRGLESVVTLTSEIPGGADTTHIRLYIQNAFETWPVPPTYVLLIGDVNRIPAFEGVETGYVTDLYYSTLTPGDYFPDVGLGRLSAGSLDDALVMAEKILDYEQVEWGHGTGWCERAYFMASDDPWNHGVAEGTQDYCMAICRAHGMICDSLYEYYGTGTPIATAINDGRVIAAYSGHGYDGGWAGPKFDQTNVRSLTNLDLYPLVTSHACNTGNFEVSECFAETWIRVEDKGAVAFWGSAPSSYWTEDDTLQRSMFRAVFYEDLTWLSGMMDRAKYAIYQAGFSATLYYYEAYNLFGDPSMDLYTDQPATPEVIHPDVFVIGEPSLTVEVVGVEGALVCAYTSDYQVYETAYTDAEGVAVLYPDPPEPGTLFLTVTAHNHRPYQGSIPIIVPSGPYVVYHDHVIDDDNSGGSSGDGDGMADAGEIIELPVILKNVGMEDATSVTATLSASGDPYVTITDSFEEYGDIGIGDTVQSLEDYDFQVSADCPDGHAINFVLDITAVEGSWQDGVVIMVQAPVIRYASHLIDDTVGGNGNGVAEPGETVEIEVTLENAGSGEALDVAAELSSDDQYIDILSGNAGYGDILPGGTGVSVPSYQVYIHEDCPGPHFPEFVLSIETAQGQQFSDLFSIAIASPGFTDDMESGENGWTHYAVTSGYLDEWHLETYRSNSPTHSWKCGGSGGGDYSNYVDAGLVTPLVVLEPGSELTFWHWMDAEIESGGWAWDGGIVEISTDMGESWVQIEPEGGYPYQIVDNPDSPFPPGTPCFSGRHDWKEEVFDLSAYSGAVYIRFRFGTDGYVTEEGWYIDDVKVGAPLPDVTVTLEPDATVIPRGGKLGFTATVTNNTQDTQGFNFWTEVILPNGKPYPKNPVIGPMWVTLAPGEEKSKHASHRIPGSAPLGTYTYTAKIGTYPEPLMHSDSFQFTVVE